MRKRGRERFAEGEMGEVAVVEEVVGGGQGLWGLRRRRGLAEVPPRIGGGRLGLPSMFWLRERRLGQGSGCEGLSQIADPPVAGMNRKIG